jgi:hypothetical protein
VFVQVPSHSVNLGWQDSAQAPPAQTSPSSHATSHAPQWSMSVAKFVQVPLHSVSSAWHSELQVPAEQTMPGSHSLLQVPQWALLL